MNVRQKLSLAAMCIALPALASAQAAAPAAPAEAAPAAAAPAAPALEVKAYGFALLTYNQNDGRFNYPDYPGIIAEEDVKTNVVSIRQSRLGFMINNADSGILGAKLGGKFEWDFMGSITAVTDSVPVRLRYAYGQAAWDLAAAGKVTLTLGQTDGLVNPLHPELGAYIALPTFLQAGNLTRRSPQIRVGYDYKVNDMVALTAEVAALSAADKGGNLSYGTIGISAGNASGQPDIEARLQGVVKPMADVKATIGVGYHTNKRTYDAGVVGSETDLTATMLGVDVNVEATKYVNIRGEWYTSKGADDSYGGPFGATTGTGTARELNETTGFWVQGVVKPLPYLWVMGGFGQAKFDDADSTNSMMNLGVLAPVGKNLRLGLEYTTTKAEVGTVDASGSQIALSSRFSF